MVDICEGTTWMQWNLLLQWVGSSDVNPKAHSVAPNSCFVWLLRGLLYQTGSLFKVWVGSWKQLYRWASYALQVCSLCASLPQIYWQQWLKFQTLMVWLLTRSLSRPTSKVFYLWCTTCATYTCINTKK